MTAIIFAAIIVLFIFVLVVLSLFVALRRVYHRPRDEALLNMSTIGRGDIEAQGGRHVSFGNILPLPVSASSSASGATLAGRLTSAFRLLYRKLHLNLKCLPCFVASGAGGFLGFAQTSWRTPRPRDADIEADCSAPRAFPAEEARWVITLHSDEDIAPEASSPASKYAQLDSPTVETPILGSSIKVRVHENTFEGDYVSPLVVNQVYGCSETYDSNALVEPGKDSLTAAYVPGFDSHAEQREQGDRLVGALVALLSSESLSGPIGDDVGDDGASEEPYQARFDDTTEYLVEVQTAFKHVDSCTAIVHWRYGSIPSSETQSASERSLEGVDWGYLEANASFYSYSGSDFARGVDDRQFMRDFSLSPVASGEVCYGCYG
ncbi:hypothetical protein C8Q78DRAFT_1078555 [Trametes maxima]|nr:hypothetical protein C8Q78DRAFT_1078555 [Trametes maxima]